MSAPPLSRSVPAATPAWRRWWMDGAILLVALALRSWAPELKPPHFDEGVNGWFVDRMAEQGCYHYDPTNFHGPLHFYLLFLAQTLFGRHIWALRLPVVLVSTAAVGLMLCYRRYLHPATCRLAALAMAVSPAMTFYGRYAIHESELLAFLMLTVWGLLGVRRFGDYRSLVMAALGATGCVLTKETYAIHFVALLLAWPSLIVLERATGTPAEPWPPRRWTGRQEGALALVCLGLIVFFYSGNFLDWHSLTGLVTTFRAWVGTGVDPEGGHAKAWYYWFELLGRYEAPACVGVACAWLVIPVRSRDLRYLTLAGAGAFVAYTIVRYKTPWCIITIMWPLLLLFGEGVRLAAVHVDRWVAGALAAIALGCLTVLALELNFRNETRETEPYVYVQTLPAIHRVLDPLQWLVAQDSARQDLRGFMLFSAGDGHPLQWLLGDFPHIEFLGEKEARPDMDAEILLIDAPYVSDVEDRLHDSYFREEIVLRGNSGETAMLYLRAATFAPLFPGRTPEFPVIQKAEEQPVP